MMARLAILGSYPEGPEASDYAQLAGQWSPWKHGNSSPYKIWADAESELHAVLGQFGAVNVYVYYGQAAPVPTVLQVDKLAISQTLMAAPGPSFFPDEQAHVWVRYRGGRDLKTKLSGSSLTEMVPVAAKFTHTRPIGEASWTQMYRTGLIFVEDPLAR